MKRRNVRFKIKTVPLVRFWGLRKTQTWALEIFQTSKQHQRADFICLKSFKIHSQVRTLSLIIVTFTYLLVGAAIFDYLEGDNNEKAYKVVQSHFLFNVGANKKKLTLFLIVLCHVCILITSPHGS